MLSWRHCTASTAAVTPPPTRFTPLHPTSLTSLPTHTPSPPAATCRYCSQEHQKLHYAQHKAACKVVSPFVHALIESVEDVKPASYEATQRLIAAATLYAQRCAPPAHLANIFACLNNTVFCRVCFKLREQLPPGVKLECCPKCLWGWCCQGEHAEQFLSAQHVPFCELYATFRRLNMRVRQQAQEGMLGVNQLPFPMGKVSQQQEQMMAEVWDSYRRLRVPSVSDDDTWRWACACFFWRGATGR